MENQIKITANHSKRTFTIRKNRSKYRTYPFSTREFKNNLHNTGDDWNQFLRHSDGDYYIVK